MTKVTVGITVNNTTKEIKWNQKIYSIQRIPKKKTKQKKMEQKINKDQNGRLKTNNNNNHIRSKWSKHPITRYFQGARGLSQLRV